MIHKEQLLKIVESVKYKDWMLRLKYDQTRNDAPYLQWFFNAGCVKTGEMFEQSGRKWYLSPYMTESEIVLTAFKAALTAEEHECRECFMYEGKRVLNPHVSIRALMSICDQEDNRA